MRILNLKIDTNTRNIISMTTDFLGMENDNLQTKLVVELTEDLPGEARIDFEIGDEKQYAMMTKVDNKYELMLTNSMLSSSLSAIQLVISWSESDHTLTWKSKILDLHIEPSINADGEVPEEFESWLDRLQAAINEANNLDIEYEDGTITITHKDGSTSSVEVGKIKLFIPGTTTKAEISSWEYGSVSSRPLVFMSGSYTINGESKWGVYILTPRNPYIYSHVNTFEFTLVDSKTLVKRIITMTGESDDSTNYSTHTTYFDLLTSSDLNNYYDSDTVDSLLGTKVDKVTGKGLSTNDYTNTAKNKVDMIIFDNTHYTTGFESGNNVFYTDDYIIATRTHTIYLDELENIAHVNDSENYQNIQYIKTDEIQSQGKITLCDELVSKPQSAELDFESITLKEYGVTQKTINYDDIATKSYIDSLNGNNISY